MSDRRPKIAVIGSTNIDYTMKMSRLPQPGEAVTNATFLQTFGGKGANQAIAAARAGSDTWFVSCVGPEDLATRLIADFRADGMHTDFIFREEDCPSGVALVMAGEGGQNYLSVAPGSNYRLTPERIDRAGPAIEGAAMVLLQYEIPVETILALMARASARGVPVMMNYAPVQSIEPALIKGAQILVVNEGEAQLLSGLRVTGMTSAAEAADRLQSMGPPTVIVTLGPAGAWVSSPELRGPVNPFKVDAVDSTAAGDTFCGALAVGLAEGRSLGDALRFASAAAALTVTRFGAQPSIPPRAEIESFLRSGTLPK
jgi:ribokinase